MKTETYKLKVIFLTPVLGSQPTKDVASEYIAKKNGMEHLPEDEEQLLPDLLEEGTTIFHRDAKTGAPLLMNYHVLGFLKEAARVQNGQVTGGVRNLRSKVEQRVFISPRFLPLVLPKDGELDYLERPLRAETAKGPRVALARSEMLPEGTSFSCGITLLKGEISETILEELLDYGMFRGMGLWRNSGAYGTFRYELTKEADGEDDKPLVKTVAQEMKA
jgi:hypothetical protein